ncbi:MAG TPA: DEAD/DEAH box helicase, partial [Xanthomonadaceae bacterium]|nr:DEAD/DEAH box helicase [Xanthomonadaceae bacterium]
MAAPVPKLDDALSAFHPAVARWFRERFDAPTEAQAHAWQVAAAGGDLLVSAPTGSGKTLAAFLAAIDALVCRGCEAPLPDAVQVLYVSPLKALSNDIEKNLAEPLAGIRDRLFEAGLGDVDIRSAVRTGDTSQAERALMRRRPPHILVTTPESLFILLTSEAGRAMLGGVRTVIVDELHAVAGSKRGAHLMLSLERLAALTPSPPQRLGLSATVKPIEEVAGFLAGAQRPLPTLVDAGHARRRDLALELPRSPLEAVMAHEVWAEVYDRLAALAGEHRTTLVFVNQRRLAERVARHLGERIGEEHVAAHHGSLAKEHRLAAEQRLKAGQLRALVATSSLELGIDIGDVDLVCQLGSPRAIAAFLQRVGRAGHAVGAVPKGRLFPLSPDDLLECTALLDAVRRGELDRVRLPRAPLDVLAQQIVAEVACREWDEDALFALVRRAVPYRALERADFDAVVAMLAEGYATRRGRRGAYLHHDAIHRRLRARRGARLTAVTNAGVIPDQFDADVVLLPEEQRIGSLNEDFAFESIPGDIFQLGNHAYRIVKIETGKVYVEDARGKPPTLPFWLGEAPARSDELSFAVSRLTSIVELALDDMGSPLPPGEGPGERVRPERTAAISLEVPAPSTPATESRRHGDADLPIAIDHLRTELDLPTAAAEQLVTHLALSRAALGALPTLDTLVLERFFDEVGDTHLVIHSPYGSRINRAFGLALRKRFCRQFNFELQASALEDSIVLSLGPTHSFPLEDVARFLHSSSARDVLIQALLDAPMFGTRWRWNASIALAVKRMVGGRRLPPQFQRSDAEDLLTLVFPEQLACAENLTGEREIPDHPLVAQTLDDCLHQTMDVDGFLELLRRIENGTVRVVARDLAAPSPLAHSILSARPYAFLDDGEAEERRTRNVATERLDDLTDAAALARLDPAAIARVRAETWPEVADADELHDALLVHGFLSADEVTRLGEPFADALATARRATCATTPGGICWVAAERLHEFLVAVANACLDPVLAPMRALPERDAALRELIRGRLELLGPASAAAIAAPLGVAPDTVEAALLHLEAEGAVMRGCFEAASLEQAYATRPVLRAPPEPSPAPNPPFVVRSESRRAASSERLEPPAAVNKWNLSTSPEPSPAPSGHPLPEGEGKPEQALAQRAPQSETPQAIAQWCERRLLARIHRYSREQRRAGVQPVPAAAFLRFLFAWHGLPHADMDRRREGESALPAVLEQLEGFPLPIAAWEDSVLPARLRGYLPSMLDHLCTAGRIAWWRAGAAGGEGRRSGPLRSTPVLLADRLALAHWQRTDGEAQAAAVSSRAERVLHALKDHGASFLSELENDTGMLQTELEQALGELVALGLV